MAARIAVKAPQSAAQAVAARIVRHNGMPLRLEDRADGSVNWVEPAARRDGRPSGGADESRYVRREARKVSAYVSSDVGCRMGCAMCWLTAEGATRSAPATLERYVAQLSRVVSHYAGLVAAGEPAARDLYVNFMARGDALANPVVLFRYGELYDAMAAAAAAAPGEAPGGLALRMNVSSIFPRTVPRGADGAPDLGRVFSRAGPDGARVAVPVHLYYSLYSADPAVRRALVPRAEEPERVLAALAAHQARTGEPVTIHGAELAGLNGTEADARRRAAAIRASGVWGKYNQVRYNAHPHRAAGLAEADAAARDFVFAEIAAALAENARRAGREAAAGRSKQVARVGPEALASCGTFVTDPGAPA